MAEYTENEIGGWLTILDDTPTEVPKTAFIAKTSFTRHVTNVVLESASIHIGCQAGKNFLFVDFDVPIKNSFQGKKHNIEFQLDEGKINAAKWNLASNKKALLVPKPESFIKQLFKAQLVLFKIENESNSDIINSYFNISDLSEAFIFVKNNCQWK
ncbi:MAG: hypothetical protein LBU69_05070 [Deltaproteobacteria bacterium]|nr:hypothetical protein [Deltaproteobacteria bacterium]